MKSKKREYTGRFTLIPKNIGGYTWWLFWAFKHKKKTDNDAA